MFLDQFFTGILPPTTVGERQLAHVLAHADSLPYKTINALASSRLMNDYRTASWRPVMTITVTSR